MPSGVPQADPVWDFIAARQSIDLRAHDLWTDRAALSLLRQTRELSATALEMLWSMLERRARPFVNRSVWKLAEPPPSEFGWPLIQDDSPDMEYHFEPERDGNRYRFHFATEVREHDRDNIASAILENVGVQAYCGLHPKSPLRDWREPKLLMLGN